VTVYSNIDQMTSAMTRRIHDWWMSHRRGEIPDRSDFDPAEFKDLLPYILISDVEASPFRIRYRLVGTRAAEATGFNIVGRYLDELMPTEPEAPWLELYELSFRQREPVIGACTCTTTNGGLFTYEYGLFPLRRGSRVVAQFLAIEDYCNLASTLTDLVQWTERDSDQKESNKGTHPASVVAG